MGHAHLSSSDSKARRNVRLGSLGAALEYYDFVVYLYVATLVGAAFFPSDSSDALRLVQTLSIYAIGYAIRPIAGIVIARFADQIGRKRIFVATVAVMSLTTLAIGVLPTYEQVGWLAPALLILLRILQGCAFGGELPAAGVFVAEHGQRQGVARAGSHLQMLVFVGFFLGATVAFGSGLLARHLTPDTPSLAWRLPFILGGILGLIAMYLRRKLDETPVFENEVKERRVESSPVRTALKEHPGALILGGLVVAVLGITNTSYITFWPTYLQVELGYSSGTALASSLISIAVALITMPWWGRLADRRGWRFELMCAAATTTVGSLLMVAVVPDLNPNSTAAFWIQIPACVGAAGAIAIVPGLISSLFPAAVRQTGYAISYNLVIALSGFLAPAMVGLLSVLGPGAPMYIALLACVITVVNALVVTRMPLYLGNTETVDQSTTATPTAR